MFKPHRQRSYRFISAGGTAPRAAAEQRLVTGLFLCLALLVCNSVFLAAVCLAHLWQLFPDTSLAFWEPDSGTHTVLPIAMERIVFQDLLLQPDAVATPGTWNETPGFVPDHKICPQTDLCPDQLHYHMHKNIYCLTSGFSVKVNRNWPGVASQTLTVGPEAQHKYRGASECKCLNSRKQLSLSSTKCVWGAPRKCVHTSGPLPRDLPPCTGFQYSWATPSFPQEETQMLIVMGTSASASKLFIWNNNSSKQCYNEKLIQSLWYLILGGSSSQIHFQYCLCPLSNTQTQEFHLNSRLLHIPG